MIWASYAVFAFINNEWRNLPKTGSYYRTEEEIHGTGMRDLYHHSNNTFARFPSAELLKYKRINSREEIIFEHPSSRRNAT